MKLCAICGTACANADPTCPNCGEASWINQVRLTPEPSGSTVSAAADQLAQPIAGTIGSGDAVAHSARPEPQSFQRRDDRHHNRGRR